MKRIATSKEMLFEQKLAAEVFGKLPPHSKKAEMEMEPQAMQECLDRGRGPCEGPVEYRSADPFNPTKAFPRCERHFSEHLKEVQGINERYPQMQPSDFDEGYAGERWDEDY